MINQYYYSYLKNFGPYLKRSMFGGTGIFLNDAMYALVIEDQLYLRGGEELDEVLTSKGCKKYRHVKKQTTATVNYYDISELFEANDLEIETLIKRSIELSIEYKNSQKSTSNIRLRDLPNMQLTLERMVKKSGVKNVSEFISLGPEVVFRKVQDEYGKDVDTRLLWKFAGAVDGVHWELLDAGRKKQLLESCT
ncbi:TfoX/Sxy family DNA transformation protein [Vibrio hannami]|uniref:TfoX/Sxy family DNA transformation protein n=1 Tax=Vibrio hannami TaxID=2717094 RepID=UPI00240F82F2|nr:TfoX/Sxy family DNA transformation protein [Vibrio hannami]MDG3087960.1 TfoX/Sxy family DNA transformation protein [Vibrio hannami]